MKILVIEDEEAIADALIHMLIKNKYLADACYDGESGLDNALTGIYDLIILDIMLPKINGLDVLKQIRNQHINCPVILLTAKDEISDKVTGLDYGADDYITKPFAIDELLARIRSIQRIIILQMKILLNFLIFHLIFKRIRYLVIQILFTLVLKNFVLWKFS